MASHGIDLSCMGVAELTQLIKDAEAALARREKRHAPSWWARSGQRPGPKENQVGQ